MRRVRRTYGNGLRVLRKRMSKVELGKRQTKIERRRDKETKEA